MCPAGSYYNLGKKGKFGKARTTRANCTGDTTVQFIQ